MEDYKKRFIAEYKELAAREKKLSSMIDKFFDGALDFVPTCPIRILIEQDMAMLEYLYVLEERAKIENIELN